MALAVAALAFGVAASPVAAATQFRADAAHTGVYASPTQPTLRAVKWRFRTNGMVIGSPVVDGGVVYVGSADHSLYAIRFADGRLRWSFQTGGAVNSTPAVAGGRVYFGSVDGTIYALDAKTGKPVWRYKTRGEQRFTSRGLVTPPTQVSADAFDVLLSSPAVVAGTVYVGSGDHNVYALDAATGKPRWRFETGDVVHSSPAVSGGDVYIGSFDRNLYKLDARTGALRWRFATDRPVGQPSLVGIPGSAAVAAGLVYFGARDGHFYAVDAATGKLRWKRDDRGSWIVGAPAIGRAGVYVTTSDELRFFALNAATGVPRFSMPYKTYAFSSPALSGRFAYFGTFDGILHKVDTSNGRQVAAFRTEESRRNGQFYLEPDGRLRDGIYGDGAVDATYLGVDRLFSLGSIVSSPTVSGGIVIFGSTDGSVYALR